MDASEFNVLSLSLQMQVLVSSTVLQDSVKKITKCVLEKKLLILITPLSLSMIQGNSQTKFHRMQESMSKMQTK